MGNIGKLMLFIINFEKNRKNVHWSVSIITYFFVMLHRRHYSHQLIECQSSDRCRLTKKIPGSTIALNLLLMYFLVAKLTALDPYNLVLKRNAHISIGNSEGVIVGKLLQQYYLVNALARSNLTY
jgi:hypothetical protein